MEREAVDTAMLRTLSMNSRFSIKKLAARLGEKTTTTYDRIRAMEKALGLKYILQIEPERLGYYPYITTVKFKGAKPDAKAVREAFASDSRMQLVALAKGDTDMFCYFLAKDNNDAVQYLQRIRATGPFKGYNTDWSATPYHWTYGFIPLRKEFFTLLEEKVWQRTRDAPRPESGQITRKEYELLKFMHDNANADFSDVDKELHLEKGMAHYIYNRLLEKGVILRPTITIGGLPLRYSTLHVMKVVNGALFEEKREGMLRNIIGDSHVVTNKYALIGNTLNPLGSMFIAPSVVGGKSADEELAMINGVELSSSVLTDIPIGHFCHRLYDNAHSSQYRVLIEIYKKERFLTAVDYNLN